MNRKLFLVIALLASFTILACDASTLIALNNPTATPTRTPRPTFTPRPIFSPTPEQSPTPPPTATSSIPPIVPPTQRASSSLVVRPTATKPPAPPPAPKFPVTFVEGYLCEQPGNAIWKITGRVNQAGSSNFLGGYVLGAFNSGGKFLKASAPSVPNDQVTMTIGGNCRAEKFSLSNVDFDVSELRMEFPITIRVIRSANDPTALSADFVARFDQPGNYFLQYHVP